MSIWPTYEARFFEFGLFGMNKKATNYFPNNSSLLNEGSSVDWYIFLHNHMGNVQNVSVKVKLLSSTQQLPNDREHEPSPLTSFVEFPLLLSVNDTVFIPFSWSILEVDYQNSLIDIRKLIVNDKIVEVDVPASSDSNFYIVFELWVYNQTLQQYSFTWESEEESFSTSLHMGFRANIF